MKRAFAFLAMLSLAIPPALGQATGSYYDIEIGRSWPRSIAVNPLTNQVFVATLSGIYPPTGFTIAVIDATNNSIVSVVPYAGIPGEMTIDLKTDTVYIVNSTSIVVLDGTTKRITGSVNVKTPLYDVAFDPNSRLLYATGASNLFRINATRQEILGSVPVGSYAEGIAINPGDDKVYVANFGSSSITVVDGRSFSIIKTIALPHGTTPSSLALDVSTNKLFATTGRNSVLAIDGGSGGVLASIAVGNSPTQNSTYALAIDSHSQVVFVASTPGTVITAIDAVSYGIVASIRLGFTPFEIAFNPSNGNVYVTNYHLVSVINSESFAPSPPGGQVPIVLGIILVTLAVAYLSRRWSRMRKTTVVSTSLSFHCHR
jgi:DNA-binding beta-propeller fold protein YncE